jgi:hypothetical protein
MTAELFAQMAHDEGLRVLEQFDSWGPDGMFKLSTNWDAVTVLTK